MMLYESAYTSLGMDNAAFLTQMQGMSLQQEAKIANDHVLFSWMEDEDAVLTNGAITLKDGTPLMHSDYNLRSKRRLTKESTGSMRAVLVDRPPDQPVTNSAYPRKEFIPYKSKEPKVLTP